MFFCISYRHSNGHSERCWMEYVDFLVFWAMFLMGYVNGGIIMIIPRDGISFAVLAERGSQFVSLKVLCTSVPFDGLAGA